MCDDVRQSEERSGDRAPATARPSRSLTVGLMLIAGGVASGLTALMLDGHAFVRLDWLNLPLLCVIVGAVTALVVLGTRCALVLRFERFERIRVNAAGSKPWPSRR
ncbi:MAG: hypothetical protein AB8G96_05390 [Phycisphaerales bacterium]